MSSDSKPFDLADLGLIPSTEQTSKEAEGEEIAEMVLGQINATLERVMSSLTAQHLLVQTLETRVGHLEKLLTMLALKDPTIGPTIMKMAKTLNMDLNTATNDTIGTSSEQPQQ